MPTRCEIALAEVVVDLAIILKFTGENRRDQGAAINALEQVAAERQALSAGDIYRVIAALSSR
ncbi:hypothetical protein PF050_17120 [Kosakonia pseudosacchari]|uniref:hypothetical protein n=1 Tax=Kosakonia pseudosacchari TaxID=1646340 RepID=UPI0022F01E10|nr:hypothetical protein [Kosakonia pseudosacchari]WBU48174.1 hypothetical protein PF050_17120 [Kosakonia pseudosacchari]